MLLLQQEAQGEGDGTSEATVRHDELVFGGQFDDTELVDDKGQTNNTWERKSWEEFRWDLDLNSYVTDFYGL